MKKFKLLPIDIGFDDSCVTLPYRQEAQELFLLLDKYGKDFKDIDNEEINEPNNNLINNLVNSLDSLNELEFIIALKKVQKLNKFYPITISFNRDLGKHYKNFAKVTAALKSSSSFADIVKMLESNFDDTTDEFISYINGFNYLLSLFKYDTKEFREYLKHYRRSKYILNYSSTFDYLNWHLEQDLFGELRDIGKAKRAVNVEIFNFMTAKKIGTIQIIINLQTAKNEYTEDTYQIGFKSANIEYRYIKAEWIEKYGKALVDDFTEKSKTYAKKELSRNVTEILEARLSTFEDLIQFQKDLIALHNDCYKKEIYKNKCQHKINSHSKPCGKEFLTYDKRTPFCCECVEKSNLNAQRTRMHRERKARK